MISAIADALPFGIRAKALIGMLGLIPDEAKALDELVATAGSHPVFVLVTGRELRSVSDAIKMMAETQGQYSEYTPVLRRALESDQIKHQIAETAMNHVLQSPKRQLYVDVLEKIGNLPLPPFSDQEFEAPYQVISHGILPAIHNFLPDELEDQSVQTHIVKCRYCNEVYALQEEDVMS